MWKFCAFQLAVLAVSFWNVKCLSEDEKMAIMEAMKPIAEDCAKDCGLDEEYFKKHKKDGIPPCFKKCLLKKIGILDSDGKYNRDTMREQISQFAENKEDATKMQDKLDGCFDAKGDNIGDDEESEMKRVDILFQCLKELKE